MVESDPAATIFRQTCNTPIGWLTVSADESAIFEIALLESPPAGFAQASALTGEAIRQLDAYFRGFLKEFTLPYRLPSYSAATQKVLGTCATIPWGEVLSYGELADRSKTYLPPQTVGQVMAHNQLLILIPCHRVIAADGHLTGYSAPGGLDAKTWLLMHEGQSVVNHRIIHGQPGLFPDRPKL